MIIDRKTAILQSKEIWETFKDNVDWKPIPNRPQSIDTVEFGEKSQKVLNQTLKDVFGAKPPNRHANSRGLVFDAHILDKMSRVYDVDVNIKVQEGEVKDGTLGTLGTHIGLYRYLVSDNAHMDYAEEKREDCKNQPKTGTNAANSEESTGEDKSTLCRTS